MKKDKKTPKQQLREKLDALPADEAPAKKPAKVARSLKKAPELTDEEIAALEAKALAEEAEEESLKVKSGSIVPDSWKKAHPEGNCGDRVAQMLKGLNRAQQAEVAAEYGVDYEGRWGHLSNGQARMCFGCVLRTLLAKKDKEASVAE